MLKRDYFERAIEQITSAVSKVIGLAHDGSLDDAEAELEAAWTAGLSFKRGDADRLDDATLKMLLGPKAALVAALFGADAAIAEARGDTAKAARLRARERSFKPPSPPAAP